jgi:hypothetical protein
VALPIDLQSGQRLDSRGGGDFRFDPRGGGGDRVASAGGTFMEYFKLDDSGHLIDTQNKLAGRGGYGNYGEIGEDNGPFSGFQSFFGGRTNGSAPPGGGSFGGGPFGGRPFGGGPFGSRGDDGPPPPQPGYRRPPIAGDRNFEGAPVYRQRQSDQDDSPPVRRNEPWRRSGGF